jgi:hypothetical protein
MTTYTRLALDVAAWSARGDLAEVLPAMCGLFEARVNRKLRVRQMEASFSGTIVDSVIAQPANFLQFKRLNVTGHPHQTLQPQALEVVRGITEGIPYLYALDGANVRFNGTGDIEGTYYQAIPSIFTAGHNWLSTSAYDAYLWGVLAEVYGYQRDEVEQQKALARSVAILDSIEGADKRLNGPLVARAV